MFTLEENYIVSRNLASQGMVLLKNRDNILPFKKGDRVGIIGKEATELVSIGGGSGSVKCEYIRSLEYGLSEKAAEGKLCFDTESITIAASDADYTIKELNRLAVNFDSAIVTLRRYSAEGQDRRIGIEYSINEDTRAYAGETAEQPSDQNYERRYGYYYPSKRELDLFSNIQKSNIKNVILILNFSSITDISFIENFSKIKAVLLAYLPGMEGGTAIADILCGDVNPSGRLVDTIANKLEDYPSSEYFDYNQDYTEYKESIFVGYRYFETYAKEKVLYPFGFGLSYTEFEYSDMKVCVKNGIVSVSVTVKNIGERNGREVVQVYVAAPKGELIKPALELRGFAKTGELLKGQSEKVKVEFKVSDMASFDTNGVTGYPAAYVLEKGKYEIFVGKSIRNLYKCGNYVQAETKPTQQLSLRFGGEVYQNVPTQWNDRITFGNADLYDVANGKTTIESFINTLNVDELIDLAMGQPPSFPCGTGGIGNLKDRGVPNSQTADGPAGIRRSINSTCFPCGTLLASSFDKELQYKMGVAMGFEAYSTGIDIILAPALNIHRNPLCGRNFEYYSEDPLVSGKTAAAIVNGIQSKGVAATIKHFAANNCEYMRRKNDSRVDERALREIYLKGFEIAVKESNPMFVMSSYNKINGVHASANAQLLKGVLRDEWGYGGTVMTDWRNYANLDDEIIAGNNIKMPYGYPEQIALAKESYKNGKLPIWLLRENAKTVLNSIMKLRSFKLHDFGYVHTVNGNKTEISALHTDSISSTKVMESKRGDGVGYLYQLNLDQRAQRTFVCYALNVENEGEYKISASISTNYPQFKIMYYLENNLSAVAECNEAVDRDRWYSVDTKINLKKGRNFLKVVFAAEEDERDFYQGFFATPKEDIKFASLSFEPINK